MDGTVIRINIVREKMSTAFCLVSDLLLQRLGPNARSDEWERTMSSTRYSPVFLRDAQSTQVIVGGSSCVFHASIHGRSCRCRHRGFTVLVTVAEQSERPHRPYSPPSRSSIPADRTGLKRSIALPNPVVVLESGTISCQSSDPRQWTPPRAKSPASPRASNNRQCRGRECDNRRGQHSGYGPRVVIATGAREPWPNIVVTPSRSP